MGAALHCFLAGFNSRQPRIASSGIIAELLALGCRFLHGNSAEPFKEAVSPDTSREIRRRRGADGYHLVGEPVTDQRASHLIGEKVQGLDLFVFVHVLVWLRRPHRRQLPIAGQLVDVGAFFNSGGAVPVSGLGVPEAGIKQRDFPTSEPLAEPRTLIPEAGFRLPDIGVDAVTDTGSAESA